MRMPENDRTGKSDDSRRATRHSPSESVDYGPATETGFEGVPGHSVTGRWSVADRSLIEPGAAY
jgi:hypothetical protein